MATIDRTVRDTHEVTNQAPPIEPYDVFECDRPLREALEREGGAWGVDRLRDLGAVAGTEEARAHAERCERNEPRLVTHDRYGNRVDEVDLDPSWHWLLRVGIERELSALPWRDPRPGAHVVRAALFYTWSQVNAGVMCPISMTYAVIPSLRDGSPELAAEWEPRLTLPDYDRGAIAGMAMTEKQGGSDVRANSTRAVPLGDGSYELWGHKWFCSYPPCDVFLTLAQTDSGLSCFLIEGRDPGFRVQRLKEKLGTRSLPSSEVEYHGVRGLLVGEEGRGVRTIIRMVNHTRLDCLIGSAAGMRWSVAQAAHHARHRATFGKALADHALMRNVLADLQLESEAATATALRLARAYDEDDRHFRRFGTAVMKYWVCKRAPGAVGEALECLGGNGYVEESNLPRAYRDAPLNSIWEGSGNVAALDVLRAMTKEPDGLPAFLAEVELAAGADPRLDAHVAALRQSLAQPDHELRARRIVEDLALALQGSLLVRGAPPAVADAFCAARLGGEGGRAYGTLPAAADVGAIVERILPS
jgi:putative acyl-CoA dehydrogenase